MRDCKGKEINLADPVLLPCRVRGITDGNLVLEPIADAPPRIDGGRELPILMHPCRVIRAQPGDKTDVREVVDDGRTMLR